MGPEELMTIELDDKTACRQTAQNTCPSADTVLVVDDSKMMRKLAEMILNRDGYRVILAENGLEALDQIVKEEPDLILMDRMMPEMNGFDVCRRLRQDSRFVDTPVIFLTAKADASDKAAGFAAGGSDYIVKPFDPLDLLARVRTHMELSCTRRLLRRQTVELGHLVA